ncbi:HAD-like domain-containing protein [Fimicolochytrium jonesii]|uniref:HAD-like domain-containing protein n=1 Tax=Fimicolochytrium jonesii TaxID=1396493 RepID=UPI0022FEE1B8|nr:HAD-like domain-containing protein [Fimicolochytrium jonesii]KAI8825015.1 HAD-like domain-containing protein [Fimicolochytrium jonesii]
MDPATIKKENVKLIVSDVDGTLLDSAHEVPAKTRNAILAIRKSHPDLPFIIATGKPFAATLDIRRDLNLTPFHCIHTNGCLIYGPNDANDGTTLDWAENLETDFVRRVVRENRKRQIGTFVYVTDEVFEVVLDARGRVGGPAREDGKGWLEILRAFGEDVKVPPEGFLERLESGDVKVQKMVLCVNDPEVPAFRQHLVTDYPATSFHLTQALTFALELLPLKASKQAALQHICDELGITVDNVLAFGDGENDAGMLGTVKYGVVMPNGMEGAKKAAAYVAPVTNDEAAVGVVLDSIFGQ